MDINTKLNMTFLIFVLLSVLFVKVESKNKYDPSYLVRATIGLIFGVSFVGFVITCFIRIWA
jgi:hypothetical protein